MKIKIIQIFGYYDEEDYDGDCGGDYSEVEVLIDDVVVVTYGDYYHDKGDVAADAFVAGYLFALDVTYEIEYVNEARKFE